jgi:iron complex outermembrane receptor protein
MSNLRLSIATVLVAAAAAAAPAVPAQAQTTTSPTARGGLLEEIVVTAQRREEKIQDVPIAVTALNADQLTRLNVTETLDLIRIVPNLMGSNNTGLGTANVYSLRALNNTESIATFDPPVGTYVDDVFIARQNANNFTLFDVDRVEVLRGPQGTLFGRNTTGGAVSVFIKKPSPELGGYLEAGFGQFGEYRVRGSVDLPASDTFLTKLSAYYIKNDGYVDDPTTGENNLNDRDSYGVRAAARWLASDAVTWDLSFDYMKDDWMNLLNFDSEHPQSVGLAVPVSCAAGGPSRSRFSCTGLRTDQHNLVGIVTGKKQNFPLGNVVKSFSVISNIGWETDAGLLNFITGYRDMKQDFALDFFNGAAPYGGFTIANAGKHKQFTQEIKLAGEAGALNYVTGVYYLDEDNNTDFGDIFNIGFPFVLEDRVMKNTTKAWAVYGQADWRFVDRWVATLGVRYTDETKKIGYTANANPNISPTKVRVTSATIAAAGIPLEQSTGLVTPRLALQFNATDDVNFFASATRGFKSGGWNARGTSPSLIQPFSAEKVWSYELGMKSDWMDGRLRFNLTGFYSDIQDFQLPSAFNGPTGITFITRNFAGMENKGAEVELVWAATDALTLFANVGIQSPKYKDLDPSIVQQLADCQAGVPGTCGVGIVTPDGKIAEPVRAPDTFTIGANYSWQITPSLQLVPNVYATRLSDHNVGTSGTPASLVSSYTIVNAGVTLQAKDWSIAANCRNCSNETYVHSVLPPYQYLGDPRTWGVNVRYDF